MFSSKINGLGLEHKSTASMREKELNTKIKILEIKYDQFLKETDEVEDIEETNETEEKTTSGWGNSHQEQLDSDFSALEFTTSDATAQDEKTDDITKGEDKDAEDDDPWADADIQKPSEKAELKKTALAETTHSFTEKSRQQRIEEFERELADLRKQRDEEIRVRKEKETKERKEKKEQESITRNLVMSSTLSDEKKSLSDRLTYALELVDEYYVRLKSITSDNHIIINDIKNHFSKIFSLVKQGLESDQDDSYNKAEKILLKFTNDPYIDSTLVAGLHDLKVIYNSEKSALRSIKISA